MAVSLTIKFLLTGFTDAERRLLIRRLEHDGQTDMASHGANPELISSRQAFLMALADWRLWGLVLTYSMIVGAGTISYYLPTLTGNLGYDSVTAQYMTIPIYLVAVVFSIAGSFSSDLFQERKYHICVFATMGCIASIVAAIILDPTVRYVMLCSFFHLTSFCQRNQREPENNRCFMIFS